MWCDLGSFCGPLFLSLSELLSGIRLRYFLYWGTLDGIGWERGQFVWSWVFGKSIYELMARLISTLVLASLS